MTRRDENVLGGKMADYVTGETLHLFHVDFLGKALLEPHRVEKLLLLVRESVVLVRRSALHSEVWFYAKIFDKRT